MGQGFRVWGLAVREAGSEFLLGVSSPLMVVVATTPIIIATVIYVSWLFHALVVRVCLLGGL